MAALNASLEKPRLVIMVNTANFFLSHRSGLAHAAVARGFAVTVLTPPSELSTEIKKLGFIHETFFMGRKSVNPFTEFYSLFSIYKILKKIAPDVLHTFTIKPNLYVGLLSPFLKIPQVVSTVTGLGSAHLNPSLWGSFLRFILAQLYTQAFRKSNAHVVFQNSEDSELFIRNLWCEAQCSSIIPGTGVDTNFFEPKSSVINDSSDNEKVKILFPSRFLKDKGLLELISAGEMLQNEGLNFVIQLCGQIDSQNPSSINENQLEEIVQKPFIKNLGYQKKMLPIYQSADLVCLPSYREGISLALIEAAACGLAIVTNDVAGCRDVVTHGVNGYLTQSRDAKSLFVHLKTLLQSKVLRTTMGQKSRELALKKFKSELVLNENLNLYNISTNQMEFNRGKNHTKKSLHG